MPSAVDHGERHMPLLCSQAKRSPYRDRCFCVAQLKNWGTQGATQASRGAAPAAAGGPLCRAPQTVEGTTLISAHPGRGRELATLLESHPMAVRLDAA